MKKYLRIIKNNILLLLGVELTTYNLLYFNSGRYCDLEKPEIDRYVKVGFSVQDNKDDRHEYDSRTQLKKIINKVLKDTSWRLMSSGINYRLGVLTGRIRAYENEDDLVKLIKK